MKLSGLSSLGCVGLTLPPPGGELTHYLGIRLPGSSYSEPEDSLYIFKGNFNFSSIEVKPGECLVCTGMSLYMCTFKGNIKSETLLRENVPLNCSGNSEKY